MSQNEECVCRICLSRDGDEELVAPCACRGSSRYVHVSCLVSYAKSQRSSGKDVDMRCPTCQSAYFGPAGVELMELRLEQLRFNHGDDHVYVAQQLQQLAGYLITLLQFEKAKRRANEAVEMLERLQAKHTSIAVSGNPLVMLECLGVLCTLQHMSDDPEAESVEARAVALFKEHYSSECGSDTARVAMVLLILSQGLSCKNDQHKLLTRCWDMLTWFYGGENILDSLSAQDSMLFALRALSLTEMGDLDAAEAACKKILPKIQQDFGWGHMISALLVISYAQVLSLLDRPDEAQELIDRLTLDNTAPDSFSVLVPIARARLLGDRGLLNEMHAECLRLLETIDGAKTDTDTVPARKMALSCLRYVEAALGNEQSVAKLFAEARELESKNFLQEDWEDRFENAQICFAVANVEEAQKHLHEALHKLSNTWGPKRKDVLSHAVVIARRFWSKNLIGSRKDMMESWLDNIVEAAAFPELKEVRPELSLEGLFDRAMFAEGDQVRSLVHFATARPAVLEGEEGTIVKTPQHGYAHIRFGDREPMNLSLFFVCYAYEFDSIMRDRRKSYRGLVFGQQVRSLTFSLMHPRALKIGDSGIVTAFDRTRGFVNVDFGGVNPLQCTLGFDEVCASEDFSMRVALIRAASGGFMLGDRVCNLVSRPHWTPRPVSVGEVGTIYGIKAETATAAVEFQGGVRGLVVFGEIRLVDDSTTLHDQENTISTRSHSLMMPWIYRLYARIVVSVPSRHFLLFATLGSLAFAWAIRTRVKSAEGHRQTCHSFLFPLSTK